LPLLSPGSGRRQPPPNAKATLDAAATALGATSLNSIQFSGWDPITSLARPMMETHPGRDSTYPASRDDRLPHARLAGRSETHAGSEPPLGAVFSHLSASNDRFGSSAGRTPGTWWARTPCRPRLNATCGRRSTGGWRRSGSRRRVHQGRDGRQRRRQGGDCAWREEDRDLVHDALQGKLEGTLNEQNLVERIETWVDNPVLATCWLKPSSATTKTSAA